MHSLELRLDLGEPLLRGPGALLETVNLRLELGDLGCALLKLKPLNLDTTLNPKAPHDGRDDQNLNDVTSAVPHGSSSAQEDQNEIASLGRRLIPSDRSNLPCSIGEQPAHIYAAILHHQATALSGDVTRGES